MQNGAHSFDVQAAITAAAEIMPPPAGFELPTLENLSRRCDALEYQVRELMIRLNELSGFENDPITGELI